MVMFTCERVMHKLRFWNRCLNNRAIAYKVPIVSGRLLEVSSDFKVLKIKIHSKLFSIHHKYILSDLSHLIIYNVYYTSDVYDRVVSPIVINISRYHQTLNDVYRDDASSSSFKKHRRTPKLWPLIFWISFFVFHIIHIVHIVHKLWLIHYTVRHHGHNSSHSLYIVFVVVFGYKPSVLLLIILRIRKCTFAYIKFRL